MFISPKDTGIHPTKLGILAQEIHQEASSTIQMRSRGFFRYLYTDSQHFTWYCADPQDHTASAARQTICNSVVSLHVHRTGVILSENTALTAHIDCIVKAAKVLPDSSGVWDL